MDGEDDTPWMVQRMSKKEVMNSAEKKKTKQFEIWSAQKR